VAEWYCITKEHLQAFTRILSIQLTQQHEQTGPDESFSGPVFVGFAFL